MLEKICSGLSRKVVTVALAGAILTASPTYAQKPHFTLATILPPTESHRERSYDHFFADDKGKCPPYICPNQPTSENPQSETVNNHEKASSDYVLGSLELLVGIVLVNIGTKPAEVCVNGDCKKEIPPVGYATILGGAALSITGLYYLFR